MARDDDPRLAGLVGGSPAMRRVRAALSELIDRPGRPVLLVGEPGTGKELAARLLHAAGAPTGPLTVWSAARDAVGQAQALGGSEGAPGLLASPGTLLVTEAHALDPVALTHMAAAVTGRPARRGRGEGPPRLVLALETRALARFCPWGLADHLAVVYLPPLLERLEDLTALCEHLLRHERGVDGAPLRLRRPALDALARPWPNNVDDLERALRALVERHRRPAFKAVPRASLAALDDAQVARVLAARRPGEAPWAAAARLGLAPAPPDRWPRAPEGPAPDACAEPPVGWRPLPAAPAPLPRGPRVTREGWAAAAAAAVTFPPALLAAARALGWA
ncbi:MAG: sigma 54-interacting transcriptional regulator [Planctomycetes bacterium]|nr:sigma 54-interacting transcriptional regulator [Planctomycetota bacterium]